MISREGKFIYRNKKTGELLQVENKMIDKDFELVYELKDAMIKSEDKIRIK